jgi:hypothetical protein
MAIKVTTRSSTRTSVTKANPNPNRIKVQFLGIHVLAVNPMDLVECHFRLFVSQHLLDDLHRDFM